MKEMLSESLTLLTDFYQITMMNGYFSKNIGNKVACFEMFFRRTPFGGGYCVAAGLDTALSYAEKISFSDSDLDFLRQQDFFSNDFLEWLKSFRFSGTIFAVPEGTLVFPNEPIVRVVGPLIEVQFLETFFLNVINFQTLIATKASRIFEAGKRAPVLEFGLRRAHGPNGALSATRASFIGGCSGTSNVMAGRVLGIPISGTMAHSWVMSFPDEVSAFRAYSEVYPDSSVLLVDTFDTLREGIPNAITVGLEMKKNGKKLKGIRLDSGDLAFLSSEGRKMLDAAGLDYVKIVASNDLDEWIIEALIHQGAKIDLWGVGTKLVTAAPEAALGGVYKMVSMEDAAGKVIPKIKISQNVEKTTIPGMKEIYRVYDEENMMIADLLALAEEGRPETQPLEIHHPQVDYKFSRIDKVDRIDSLLKKVFENGSRLEQPVSLEKIREKTIGNLDCLHPTHRRLANPHTYKVGLTKKLFKLRKSLIEKFMK